MSVDFSVHFDAAGFRAWTSDLVRRQIPFATSLALNATAFDARKALVSDLPRHFTIRDTFTARRLNYEKSTKRNLVAYVGHRLEYMKRQGESGVKIAEAGRYVGVPTAGTRSLHPKNMTKRGVNFPRVFLKSKARRKKHGSFAVKRGAKLLVYRTVKSGQRLERGNAELMYALVPSIKIPKRWPFYDTVSDVVASRWKVNAEKAFRRALRTMRRR